MNKSQIAVDTFLSGYRCSQAVLSAFADEYDINPDLANTISLGMAGGSGVGSFCGAIPGATMVLSLKYGFPGPGNPEQMAILIEKNREFHEEFKKRHANVNCHDLIGLDVFSDEGKVEFAEKNIKETYCAKLVSDAVEIL